MARTSKAASEGNLSFLREDQEQGGGFSGALATIDEIECVDDFTYGGTIKNKQAALRWSLTIDGYDKPWEDHFTFGPADSYEVVDDGASIKSTTGTAGVSKTCVAAKFFDVAQEALEAADLDPTEFFGAGFSVKPLEGKQIRLKNVTYETQAGDTKQKLMIGSFDDDAAPKKNGKATTSRTAKGPNVEQQTEAIIEGLLEDTPKLKKVDLTNLIYKADKKNPAIKNMMTTATKDSWLADEDRPWDYDRKKGVLTVKEEEADNSDDDE